MKKGHSEDDTFQWKLWNIMKKGHSEDEKGTQ